MSKLEKIKKAIDLINDRIDSMCEKKCRSLGLDKEEVFGKKNNGGKSKEHGTLDESSSKKNGLSAKVKNVTSDSDSVKNDVERIDVDSDYLERRFGAEDILDDDKILDFELNSNGNGDESDVKKNRIEVNDGDGKEDYNEHLLKKQAIQDSLKDNIKNSDRTMDKSLVAKVGTIGDGVGKKGILGGLSSFAMKRLAKRGANLIGKRVAKRVASGALKRYGAKSLSKGGGKIAMKSASKKLPFGLGIIPAAAFAAHRAGKGDISGAGLELASGGVAALPFAGTAASFGIDGYLAKRDYDSDVRESFINGSSLYERSKRIFESESGINESVDGCCFDDYVAESKIENGILTSDMEIDESSIFYGYEMVVESFSSNNDELNRLFRILSPTDGKVSIDDLVIKDTDTDDIKRTKERISELINERRSRVGGFDLNQKQSKKAWDYERDSGGRLSNRELWHKGLDDTGDSIANSLEDYGIPSEITKKIKLPKILGHMAGAGIGGLLFGPVGAVAGTALANILSRGHDRYKQKQYDKLHGNGNGEGGGFIKNLASDAKKGVGGLVGAGIGSLLGGPVGGIIGSSLGNLGQKAVSKIASKR